MKQFESINEAFGWWLKNVYPQISPEEKKGKLTYAWRDYTHKLGISEKRMREILAQYGTIEVRTLVNYTPND